jgi:hypothetical protein
MNACLRSCEHCVNDSIRGQVKKIRQAGYKLEELTRVANKVAMRVAIGGKRREDRVERSTVVIPYYQVFSHHLKKIANMVDINVAFSYPHKLGKLVSSMNAEKVQCETAVSTHTQFVECKIGRVYALRFTCGSVYVGQTGRCINHRLTEHMDIESSEESSYSTAKDHIKNCGCSLLPDQTRVTKWLPSKASREIVEAMTIEQGGEVVVSKASIVLSEAEKDYVRFECGAHLDCLRLNSIVAGQ